MARMILNRLSMSNFKGVKSFEMRFDENRTDIFGANATGKTTLVDAFCWVLWNKDSNDNAPGSDAFHEKPLDRDGHEVHFVDTEVEIDCTLDDKPFELKRVQREHWEKKRGFIDEVYKGNESTYWINGLETKAADFKARIAEIIPADIFKLIGKLGAFNALKWQDRRTALLRLSEVDVDAGLLKQKGYSLLSEKLEETGYTVDELRQKMVDSRKLINDNLKALPVRIDEAKRAIVDMTPVRLSDVQYIADEADKDIENVQGMIAEAKASGGYAERRIRIKELELQAELIKRRMVADLEAETKAAKRRVDDARTAFDKFQSYIGEMAGRTESLGQELERAKADRQRLLDEFEKVKKISPDSVVSEVCPTCGNRLSDDQYMKAIDAVSKDRTAKMVEIRANGKIAAQRIADAEERIKSLGVETSKVSEENKRLRVEVDEAVWALSNMRSAPDFKSNSELNGILAEIDRLHDDDTSANDEKIAGLVKRMEELNATKNRALEQIAAFKASETNAQRVKELESERKEQGVKLAEVEKLIELVEQFIRDRCASLEESINKRFDNVRWKLFNTQINGGLADCCVCMIPCEAGLVSYECANTASKINADIEIVRNLSDYYGVKLPLFIDNAERINTVADANTQMITLSVSTDTNLRMEVH